MGRYVEVYVDDDDIDIDEAVSGYSSEEWLDFVKTYQDQVSHALKQIEGEYDLSDPVVRLGIITALRNEGYVVEPA